MIAQVMIDIKTQEINRHFDYIIPEDMLGELEKGMRVIVPFGNTKRMGYVVNIIDESLYAKRPIENILDISPTLDKELFLLADHLLKTPLVLKSAVYETIIPSELLMQYKKKVTSKNKEKLPEDLKNKFNSKNEWILSTKDKVYYPELKRLEKQGILTIENKLLPKQKAKLETRYILNSEHTSKITSKQNDFLEQMKETILRKDALELTSASVLNTLVKNNVLLPREEEVKREVKHLFDLKDKKVILNKEQQKAYEAIEQNKANTYLLHGITGSGKTEVYIKLIEDMFIKEKKTLILVPEIMLIGPLAQRLKARFENQEVAILHSGLSSGERYDQYHSIKEGDVKIILGTRSAIFSPIDNLGIIIIDEEHDASYIQDDKIPYDTRNLAKIRSKYHQIPLILGSATPSIESYHLAEKKEYKLLEIKQKAVNQTPINIQLIDMTKELKEGNLTPFSKELSHKIKQALEKKEQIIVLMNRKGYAPFVMCRHCGDVPKCENCQISLTYYKQKNILKCQHCGYEESFDKNCVTCKKPAKKEVGVGIEYIEEQLKKYFSARVLRLDADTTLKKHSHEQIWDDFFNKKADILLGTQMVAKGLDFPNVTLVGIIMADGLLKIPSSNAAEKTFQLITQASGRSGRHKKGDVIIQAYDTDHYAIKKALKSDYKGFIDQLMYEKRIQKMPPYQKMSQLLIEHESYLTTFQEAHKIKEILILNQITVLGPTPSLIQKRNKKYRAILTLKYQSLPKDFELLILQEKEEKTSVYFNKYATLY